MQMYTTFHANVLQEMQALPGCIVLYAGAISGQTALALVHLDEALQEFKVSICLVHVSGLGTIVAFVQHGVTDHYFQAEHFEQQSVELLKEGE